MISDVQVAAVQSQTKEGHLKLGHFCSMAHHSVDRQKWLDKNVLWKWHHYHITSLILKLSIVYEYE